MDQTTDLHPKRLPIIHINGFPGVGKLTVARLMTTMLNTTYDTPTKLIHNHLLINPADAVLHRTQPGYQNLRKQIRSAIFSSLESEPSTFDTIYIFTDSQTSDPVGSATCAEYAEMAERRGAMLISIVLECEEGENLRRLVGGERDAAGKIVDGGLVKFFRKDMSIHRFAGNDASLVVDVSTMEAEDVAYLLVRHVIDVCPQIGADRSRRAHEAMLEQ